MAKTKKGFRAGLYGVVSGILVAAILVGMTVFAFTTRYNAFSPEKVAQSYADTIVQTGDGYNALKVSLISKNQKFGNFVINAYMAPYVNDNSGKKFVKIKNFGKSDGDNAPDRTAQNACYITHDVIAKVCNGVRILRPFQSPFRAPDLSRTHRVQAFRIG